MFRGYRKECIVGNPLENAGARTQFFSHGKKKRYDMRTKKGRGNYESYKRLF